MPLVKSCGYFETPLHENSRRSCLLPIPFWLAQENGLACFEEMFHSIRLRCLINLQSINNVLDLFHWRLKEYVSSLHSCISQVVEHHIVFGRIILRVVIIDSDTIGRDHAQTPRSVNWLKWRHSSMPLSWLQAQNRQLRHCWAYIDLSPAIFRTLPRTDHIIHVSNAVMNDT